MIPIIVYYLVLPFVLGAFVLRFIKKYGDNLIPPDVAALTAKSPIEKKFYRAVKRAEKGMEIIGDYETHDEAVEWAYTGRKQSQQTGETAVFFVLNDKGEVLDRVDS
jgi:hypothetical protein